MLKYTKVQSQQMAFTPKSINIVSIISDGLNIVNIVPTKEEVHNPLVAISIKLLFLCAGLWSVATKGHE